MPFGDEAYYDGVNYPRCKARPTKEQAAEAGLFKYGVFECALPAEHDDPRSRFKDDPRVRAHSWGQVGEV